MDSDAERASCLCGQVTWQLHGPFSWMSHCHCSRCRKAHGSAFATYVGGPIAGFELGGAEHVVKAEGAAARYFCDTCGSVVPGGSFGSRAFVPVGNFETSFLERPLCHIFAASKASWFEIADELPRFDDLPSGMAVPEIAERTSLDPEGFPRGSCLCGAVAFVVTGEVKACRNCHCLRCRKARSAAYAANMMIANANGVRFTRGEDQLRSFHVPGARYFEQVFCKHCGSSMPRKDSERDLAVVPMGALDDDPGVRPDHHIFVDSKAPWFDIVDSLPQYGEANTGPASRKC
jgi:hypothetical protein